MHVNWDHAVAAAKAEVREERRTFAAMAALYLLLIVSGLFVVVISALMPFSMWTVPLFAAVENAGLLTRETTLTGSDVTDALIGIPLALISMFLTVRVSLALLDVWTAFTAGLKLLVAGPLGQLMVVLELAGFGGLNWWLNDGLHREHGLTVGMLGEQGHLVAISAFTVIGCALYLRSMAATASVPLFEPDPHVSQTVSWHVKRHAGDPNADDHVTD